MFKRWRYRRALKRMVEFPETWPGEYRQIAGIMARQLALYADEAQDEFNKFMNKRIKQDLATLKAKA